MWVLAGIGVIMLGFMLRFHPLLVVVAAAAVTGLAAGLSPVAILAAFGKAFNDTRYILDLNPEKSFIRWAVAVSEA